MKWGAEMRGLILFVGAAGVAGLFLYPLDSCWSQAALTQEDSQEPLVTPRHSAKLAECDALRERASELDAAQKWSDSIAVLNQRLQIEVEIFGKKSEEVAATIQAIAIRRSRMGENDAAIRAWKQALEIRREVFGERDWRTVDTYWDLQRMTKWVSYTDEQRLRLNQTYELKRRFDDLRDEGEFTEAAKIAGEVLVIRRDVQGNGHPDTTRAMHDLAFIYDLDYQYDKAIELYLESIRGEEKSLGEFHPGLADTICNLADVYRYQGRFAEAEPLIQRSLEMRLQCLGKESAAYADSLNFLGLLYQETGDYARAEQALRESMQIRKRVLGDDHYDYGTSLNNLGLLYDAMGDYAKAEPLLKRSLEIDELQLGPDHENTATSLSNLALLYSATGRYQEAKKLQRRALVIRRDLFGDKHPAYAESLNALASMSQNGGFFKDAETYLKISLEIQQEVNGRNHPDTAHVLGELAHIYFVTGDYVQAERLARQTLEIRVDSLGDGHPDVAVISDRLADILLAQGDLAGAETYYRSALEGMRTHIDRTAYAQSERQQLLTAQHQRYFLNDYLSLAVADESFAAQAYDYVLQWKGATLDRQSRLRRLADNQAAAPLFKELQTISSQLAALLRSSPDADRQTEWRRELTTLVSKKEQIEVEIGKLSGEFREALQNEMAGLQQVRESLPADAVLVDFLEYTRFFPPSADAAKPAQPNPGIYRTHLMAFVVCNDQPLKMLDLGSTDPIRRNIEAWRETLGNSETSREAGWQLHQQIWHPIEAFTRGRQLLLVSPDGIIGTFPLAALPADREGTYLLEQWRIAMIPVPRLLPSMIAKHQEKTTDTSHQLKGRYLDTSPATNGSEVLQPSGSSTGVAVLPPDASLLLMGDVDYDGSLAQLSPTQLAGGRRALSTNIRGETHFASLAGTAVEIDAIRRAFVDEFDPKEEQVVLLQQKLATEESFREHAPHCRNLHLATHGFFADTGLQPDESGAADQQSAENRDAISPVLSAGLFSGLAFTGANNPADPQRDDGILTAEEVAALNLEKVDLAVLSACETGLGRIAGGEGLLGLQRSFQVAGVNTTISSLWKVDDQATQVLMNRFYNNLWQRKMSRLDSLREAQLWMLKHPEQIWSGEVYDTLRGDARRRPLASQKEITRLAPEFWAAFSLNGQWK